ncbi:hypothetical protein [Mycobacteroides abscessus]|uniref:hypothetical protein n=1 Tax=Mycobacteroides abscessus TaxID=36809 RepID=UPI000373F53B|nr:hypothetical protein [Mycobacteroides abscessus]
MSEDYWSSLKPGAKININLGFWQGDVTITEVGASPWGDLELTIEIGSDEPYSGEYRLRLPSRQPDLAGVVAT